MYSSYEFAAAWMEAQKAARICCRRRSRLTESGRKRR